jgi:hypothetical protein
VSRGFSAKSQRPGTAWAASAWAGSKGTTWIRAAASAYSSIS